jgi:hypothetical protein
MSAALLIYDAILIALVFVIGWTTGADHERQRAARAAVRRAKRGLR